MQFSINFLSVLSSTKQMFLVSENHRWIFLYSRWHHCDLHETARNVFISNIHSFYQQDYL